MLANVWGPLLVASAAQRCPAKLPPCLLPYPAISTVHRVGATITAGSAAYNAVLRPQLVGSGPLASHRPLAVEACHIRLRFCEIHAIPSSVSVSSTGACRGRAPPPRRAATNDGRGSTQLLAAPGKPR